MHGSRTSGWRSVCIALFTLGAIAIQAQKNSACRINYENQNQIDNSSQPRVGLIGVVTDPQSALIPNVCLGVFTEGDHRLVASVLSNANGKFQFPLALKEGKYRLVAKLEGFGVANMKVIIVSETVADAVLHVHMRVRGIDSTSYIDTK